MSGDPVDYGRFGRQIALPEIGPRGQRDLAEVAVCFRPAGDLMRAAHERAGGRVTDDAAIVVEVGVPESRLVAAWASIEAARRVLGEAARAMPEGLLARTGG